MKTFLDSGVLLTAWRGKEAEAALAVMEDSQREFYGSSTISVEYRSEIGSIGRLKNDTGRDV